MEHIEELCCYYISFLRTIALIHQNNHWITKGKNFYGDHLLFERIYSSAQDDVDLMAERFVGIFGADCLNVDMQAKIISKILNRYSNGDPIKVSLAVEQEFLEFCQHFYDTLKKEDELTLGLDDAIMATASSRENAVFLLKQANDDAEMQISPVEARINLWKKLQKNSKS